MHHTLIYLLKALVQGLVQLIGWFLALLRVGGTQRCTDSKRGSTTTSRRRNVRPPQQHTTSRGQRTVLYCATVRDAVGHKQVFSFESRVDSKAFARALADDAEGKVLVREVTMPHYDDMLEVGCVWMCVFAWPWCCVQGLFDDRKA